MCPTNTASPQDNKMIDNIQVSPEYKKCPHCAETIRIDAVICRFCNRRSKKVPPIRKAALIAVGLAATILVVVTYYHGIQIRKASTEQPLRNNLAEDTNKQAKVGNDLAKIRVLVISACTEIDAVAAFSMGRHTYGEMITNKQEAITKLNHVKGLVLNYLSSPTPGHQELIGVLSRAIDAALVFSDLELRSAQYYVESEELKNTVRTQRIQASNFRDHGNRWNDASSLRAAERYDYEADANLQGANEKAELSNRLNTKSQEAANKLIDAVDMLNAQLPGLGIDAEIVFPAFHRAYKTTEAE